MKIMKKQANNMKDLTFIFPVINLGEKKNKEALDAAYASIGEDRTVLFVGKKEDLDLVTFKGVKKIENDGDTSYPNQVMLAVKNVTTKYFTIIEQDDLARAKWFDFVDEYLKNDNDEIFAYLPLTELIIDGNVMGYANEAFWASSFSEEIGYLDIPALEDYMNFNVHGGVFKTSEFLSVGGLKTSMKLTFWYEFLLRALYKQKRIYVIPRVGYFHNLNVEGSLTDFYTKNMPEKEADWWIELAKKEYYFPQDRNKTYEEE